ncbi:type VI secretion system Vgr family protein [Flavobacterium ustbae]|uniref:type VI secretion system Vgr family protein n=1 Tax=Flavobacterium ustbae TaxID=2488790 RepID=UPI000F7668B9|nr:phage baseplate assembly protein V [Flavobacterium ustbae]
MALQTITTIKIGELIITNFSHLKVNQKIHDHHSFALEVRQDLLVEELRSVMPFSQQLFGEKISIEIKPVPKLEDLIIANNPEYYVMQFYGVVTKVKLLKSRTKNQEETILIQGKSTSVILDNGPESNSFTKMPMEDIVNKIKSDYEIDIDVNPLHKEVLAYTVQYNESDFDFLNRLAMRNGEWFYYTGQKLVFGSSGGPKMPNLLYGVNMQDFRYDMKVIPSAFKIIENDNRKGEYATDESLNYRKEIEGFHQNFINKSNQVFSKKTVLQLNQNAAGGYGKTELEKYSKNKMRSSISGMLEIKALSEVPGVTLGNDVIIKGVDKQLEGSYRVTQITHTCDDGGSYENHFTAINFSGAVFSPKTNPDLVPICKSQTAIVTENADPDGLSGIKIQMPWQKDKGETTPYVPLLQKYGGDARGSHIIPEVGDTVFVDFQGGNAELPIVVGTMTSNKEKSGYSTPNNDLKVLETRSGNRIISDDEKGDVTIESKKGQTIAVIHGDGNIRFKAPKNIEFEAGEDFIVNAGRDIKIEAKEDIEIEAGNNITQEAENDIYIDAKGNIMEHSDNRTEIADKEFNRTSDISNEVAAEASLYSHTENMTIQSGKQVFINSSEKSNLF